MDRSKDIEQCCKAIRKEHAKILIAQRRAGVRKVYIDQEEHEAIITRHATEHELSPTWIRRIMGRNIKHYD